MEKREENIDFFFIANAYMTIEEWFEEKQQNGKDLLGLIMSIYTKLNEVVPVSYTHLLLGLLFLVPANVNSRPKKVRS